MGIGSLFGPPGGMVVGAVRLVDTWAVDELEVEDRGSLVNWIVLGLLVLGTGPRRWSFLRVN